MTPWQLLLRREVQLITLKLSSAEIRHNTVRPVDEAQLAFDPSADGMR